MESYGLRGKLDRTCNKKGRSCGLFCVRYIQRCYVRLFKGLVSIKTPAETIGRAQNGFHPHTVIGGIT